MINVIYWMLVIGGVILLIQYQNKNKTPDSEYEYRGTYGDFK